MHSTSGVYYLSWKSFEKGILSICWSLISIFISLSSFIFTSNHAKMIDIDCDMNVSNLESSNSKKEFDHLCIYNFLYNYDSF